MIEVRRIRLESAFRISAIMTVVFWGIQSILVILFPGETLGTGLAPSSTILGTNIRTDLFIVILLGFPIAGIIGGLGGVLSAFIYNLAAQWVGGIQFEIQGSVNVTANGPYRYISND